MKKILIIGGAGYLGAKLGNYLLEKNYNLKVIDTCYYENNTFLDKLNFIVSKDDARTFDLNTIKNFDVVIVLAAISNDTEGNLNTSKVYSDTVNFTIKVAKKCKQFGVKFIFPSSCSVYGDRQNLFRDDNIYPQTPYSKSKIAVKMNLKFYLTNILIP